MNDSSALHTQSPPLPPVIDLDNPLQLSQQAIHPKPSNQPSQPPRQPHVEVVDKIVIEYLRKRGFHSAVNAILHNAPTTNPAAVDLSDLPLDQFDLSDDLRNIVTLLKSPVQLAELDVRRLEDAYCELRDWIDGSLDIYKPELHAILYPILVHCFLEMVRRDFITDARRFLARTSAEFTASSALLASASRQKELNALNAIAAPQHLQENATARLFLENRYVLHLSKYAFEMVLYFLVDDQRRTILLRILNQRFRILVDEPLAVSTSDTAASRIDEAYIDRVARNGFVHSTTDSASNLSDLMWGRLAPDLYMIPDEDKTDVTSKNKSKSQTEKGKPASDAKGKPEAPKKEGEAPEEEEKPHVKADGTISESLIPLKKYRYGAAGLESSQDRKSRAHFREGLSLDTLQKDVAVLCYTFTNTNGDGLNCSSVSSDGSQVVAGFGDSTIRVWDAKRAGTAGSGEGGFGGHATRLVGHSGPVYSVNWTQCGRYVLSASEDGAIRLWSTDLKTDLVAYQGHNYPVWSAEFSPLDHYFASGSHDRTARIWSTNRIHPLRILAGHLADVDVVRWHPNCNYVATGSSDRTARLWDVREGKCVRVFSGHDGTIHSLAFSRDGKTLACGGDGSCIDVWDIRSGKRMRRLRGHASTVWSMDYSREGSILASGGADGRVCLWRAKHWCSSVETYDHEGGTPSSSDANGTANGRDGNATDADGDVNMERGAAANGNDEGGEVDEVGEDGGDEEGEKREAGGDGDEVVLLDTFETKETPVHAVKFTRKNVLIACGNFGR